MKKFDVIIVGAGTSGMIPRLRAEAGAQVLLIEKSPCWEKLL